MEWPRDADGDVFRNLSRNGFKFDRAVEIDFNIDFMNWPPSSNAINLIKKAYPEARISLENDGKYAIVQINNHLTYDFVTSTQVQLSSLVKHYQGVCESWGVLWAPNETAD